MKHEELNKTRVTVVALSILLFENILNPFMNQVVSLPKSITSLNITSLLLPGSRLMARTSRLGRLGFITESPQNVRCKIYKLLFLAVSNLDKNDDIMTYDDF